MVFIKEFIMSVQCKSCGDFFVCKCDTTQATEESAQHKLQQLQAKIASLVPRVANAFAYVTPLPELSAIVEEMQQLSAMQ